MKVKPRRINIEATSVGRGVFAAQRFRKAQVIGEVKGTIIADSDYGSTYAIDLGAGRILEPDAPFRFLNHCCQPNAELIICEEPDDDGDAVQRVYVQALARIEAGAELTIDYAWPADAAIRCECQNTACRGWIVDVNELPQVLARETANSDK